MEDANQEEVYIPLEGSATLVADEQRFELRPGMMVRVGPEQLRQILPGADGVRFVALGGVAGDVHALAVDRARRAAAGAGEGARWPRPASEPRR